MKTSALILLLSASAAHAQFKCIDAGGQVSFQQTPCPVAQKQQTLQLRATAPMQAGSAAVLEQSTDERILASMQRDRRVRELEQSIADTESEVNGNNVRMSNEMAVVRDRKRFANNNLAGGDVGAKPQRGNAGGRRQIQSAQWRLL